MNLAATESGFTRPIEVILPSQIANIRKFLELDGETQAKVVTGEIKFSHALTLVSIAPEARPATIALAKETGKGKITAAGINNAARKVGAKTSQRCPVEGQRLDLKG